MTSNADDQSSIGISSPNASSNDEDDNASSPDEDDDESDNGQRENVHRKWDGVLASSQTPLPTGTSSYDDDFPDIQSQPAQRKVTSRNNPVKELSSKTTQERLRRKSVSDSDRASVVDSEASQPDNAPGKKSRAEKKAPTGLFGLNQRMFKNALRSMGEPDRVMTGNQPVIKDSGSTGSADTQRSEKSRSGGNSGSGGGSGSSQSQSKRPAVALYSAKGRNARESSRRSSVRNSSGRNSPAPSNSGSVRGGSKRSSAGSAASDFSAPRGASGSTAAPTNQNSKSATITTARTEIEPSMSYFKTQKDEPISANHRRQRSQNEKIKVELTKDDVRKVRHSDRQHNSPRE